MNIKHTITIAALLASAPAFAADAGFFAAGSAGHVSAKTHTLPGTTASDGDTTWAVGGGYRFNRYAGIEAGYRDYGKLKTQSGAAWSTADLTGWTYGGVVAYPVMDAVELTARAGWNRWQSEWKQSNGTSGTNTGTEPYWGVGASWTFAPKVAAVLNWTRFKSADQNTDDADAIEVGLQYLF